MPIADHADGSLLCGSLTTPLHVCHLQYTIRTGVDRSQYEVDLPALSVCRPRVRRLLSCSSRSLFEIGGKPSPLYRQQTPLKVLVLVFLAVSYLLHVGTQCGRPTTLTSDLPKQLDQHMKILRTVPNGEGPAPFRPLSPITLQVQHPRKAIHR